MAAFIADDLESLGFDADSLRGFYTDALSEQELPGGEEGQMALPCKVSPRVEVSDAVHVALTADWNGAGWAVAQVWPDGTIMGAEAIGRLTKARPPRTTRRSAAACSICATTGADRSG